MHVLVMKQMQLGDKTLPGFTAEVSLFRVIEQGHLVTKFAQGSSGTITPMRKKDLCMVCDCPAGSHHISDCNCERIDCRDVNEIT